MSQEIELKLALGQDGPEALRRHPRLRGLTPDTAHLGNTYFDTPQDDLARAQMALRPSDTSKAAHGGALLSGVWQLPEGGRPSAWIHRATVALDALADTGKDDWRQVARNAFEHLIAPGDDDSRGDARWLVDALNHDRWLTAEFGRHALRLAHHLPGAVALA
jgi:hypothetical protein